MTRLERDERLTEWLRTLIERFATKRSGRSTRTQRDDRALRRACNYLRDQPELNIGLGELAAVAGIGKFRLVRLFRERTGLPPPPCRSPTASVLRDVSSRLARHPSPSP